MQTWIDNREDSEFVGVGARFGTPLESQERHANRTRLLIADPPDLCSPPRKKVLLYSPFLVINDIPMWCKFFLLIFYPFFSFLEKSYWYTGVNANLHQKQKLQRLLVLLLSLS